MASHASSRIAQPSSAGHSRSSGSTDQRKVFVVCYVVTIMQHGVTELVIQTIH